MDDVKQVLNAREVITNDLTILGNATRTGQKFTVNANVGKAGATATVGYVKAGANTPMVTLAQNATADTFVIPIDVKVGNIITQVGIHGQIESGGNTVTIDYALRVQTAATAGSTDALIQAGTQVSKIADYLVSEHTDLGTPHTVLDGNCYYVLVTCTTGATTDIELLNVDVTYTEK